MQCILVACSQAEKFVEVTIPSSTSFSKKHASNRLDIRETLSKTETT